MKKLKIALMLVLCLIICGCAVREDSNNEPADDKDQPEEVVVDDGEEQPAVEDNGSQQIAADYSGSVAWSDDTVLDIENGPKIIYRADNGDWIYSLAASKDTVYAIIGSDAGYAGSEYRLAALDRSGNTDELKALDEYEDEIGMQLGYYDNTLYLCYSAYDGEWNYTTYAYEAQYDDQGNVSLERTKDGLCEVLDDLMKQGYSFCYDFDDFMTCLNEQNILFLKNDDSSTVASFDVEGNLIREYTIETAVSGVTTDGKILVELYTGEYRIHSLEGDSAEQIGNIGDSYDKTILDIKDGYIYYYTYGSSIADYDDRNSNNYFYRYDPVSGTESLLFETATIPGQPYVRNGVEGFTVWEDKCYFVNFDEGSLWWFACDLSDDDYALTRLGIVDEYRGIFDVASVGYEAGSYECDVCGETILEYYVETFTLSELEIPYAEQINAYLQERVNNYIQSVEEYARTGIDYETDVTDSDEHHHYYESREMEFDGVTQYVFDFPEEEREFICLEVDISGYEYYGGAHGYPIRDRYFFNLKDGSLITFGDICRVSEDEFRGLAAEYTVQDYRENGEVYFETDEESLYETVYEYAGFDCLMHLGPKGVVIEYSPYFLGPYAAGYIEVTIPYKDLGLTLTDIYGVNVGS